MNELANALIGNSAFAPVANILQAIPEKTALARPGEGPGLRSIYEEVWHMDFWQRVTLDWVEGRPTPYPEHASEGFPSNFDEGWEPVRQRFLAGTQNAAAAANDTARLDTEVACPRVGEPGRVMSVRDQLESLAAHNAYHLGRVVLLRQLAGCWPPPDGGDTW
jgi:uncharacterized damage-inducible protein DinB